MGRGQAGSAVLLGSLALIHAAISWPISATVAVFGGGAVIAFVAEALVSKLGLLEHHIGPKVLDVPLYVLFGWTGTIYVALRMASLFSDGWLVVVLTGVLATSLDVLSDPSGVREDFWTYTDDLPGPRYRGVPWWNFLGWFLISTLTAALGVWFL
ncbi:MAG: carotenoid biosynthesis protein [Halodesulfurarchaeum sp.]